ncbi:glycosyltransferase family 2 protein [Leptolyngbya ohadii]|uniref:glycosyltransferase family 2 protein n=1 Tax=Leptolyngbya ohadii TaxID=1962290 RepID=UPI000B5A0A76|nr:glycosyltransferase family 2 protein [Leptolyngbya ohadii]
MNPLVSVIIPCFNAEPYVAEAIESALNQTYPNVEVIVVDDGSNDRSVEAIQSFGDRIRFEQINHRGACAARNRGLQLSQGEFIQFLDADDVLLPNKLEVQVPVLQSDRADLVFCNGYLFGDDRPQRPIKKLLALPSPEGADTLLYCLANGFGTEGPLHRRSLLEKVKGFREGLIGAQEFELHIRLGAVGARLCKLDEFLFRHRNHDDPTRITRRPKPPGFMVEMFIALSKQLETEFPETLTPQRRRALAGAMFQHSIYAYRNGAEAIAGSGFKYARELSPSFSYQERSFYKLLAHYLEPIVLEHLLKQVRTGRNAVKRLLNAAQSIHHPVA